MCVACNGAIAPTTPDASVNAVCPGDVPMEGTPCGNTTCTYGGYDSACTTVATCANGTWSVAFPNAMCANNDPSCPSTFDALAVNSACPFKGACVYPDGACICEPCIIDYDAGPTSGFWYCRGFGDVADFTSTAACPKLRPPIGSTCAAESVDCTWSCCDPISLGADEVCNDGTWQQGYCTAFCESFQMCPN